MHMHMHMHMYAMAENREIQREATRARREVRGAIVRSVRYNE